MSSSTTHKNPTSIFQRLFQNTFPPEPGEDEYHTYTTPGLDEDNEAMLDYINNVFKRIGDEKFNGNNSVGENIKFLSEIIFEEISMKKYTHTPDPLKNNVNIKPDGQKTVHRHNHNGLNHLRSMKFGLLFYDLIERKNEDLFKKYILHNIPDTKINQDKIFFCILIGCLFTAILRINEEEASPNLKQIEKVNFSNIFEHIKDIGWTSFGYSYWHFSSSIFYLVLMKKFLDIEARGTEPELTKLVESIAIAISYYNPGIESLKLIVGTPTTVEHFKLERIQLLSCIVGAGHHMDHCRGGFSNVLNSYHVKYLVNNFSPESKYEVTGNIKVTKNIKKITYVLYKTLFVTEYLNTLSLTQLNQLIATLNTVGDIETDEEEYFKNLCETNLQNRFKNDDGTITTFYLLSTNFEVAFRTIFEEENILTLFSEHELFDRIKENEPLTLPDLSILSRKKIERINEFKKKYEKTNITYEPPEAGKTDSTVLIDFTSPNNVKQVKEKLKLMSRKFIINILLGNYDSIEVEDDNGNATTHYIFEEEIKYGMILSLYLYTGIYYDIINNFFRICNPDIIKNTIHNTRRGRNKIKLDIYRFLSKVGTPGNIKTFGRTECSVGRFLDTEIITKMNTFNFLDETEKSRTPDIIQKINKYFGNTSTKKLKGKDIIYYIILFYSLFIELLNKLCEKEGIEETDLSIVYRGSEDTSLQYQKTYEKKGSKTKINALTSTSTDIHTASNFADGTNLFIIAYSPSFIPGLFVRDISIVPIEEEFLFPPSIIFDDYVNIPNCKVRIIYSDMSVSISDRHETIELLGIKSTDYIKQPTLQKPGTGKKN